MAFNLTKYIGIIHLSAMIIQDLYGIIIRKNIFFDKLYLISFVFIPFSWIILKDECFISYIIKKIENNNYLLGECPDNVKDITDLFINKNHYFIFYNINNLLRIFSIIIVNNRTTKINNNFLLITCILYLFYNYDITYKFSYRKLFYPYFQIILCFCFLQFMLHIISK